MAREHLIIGRAFRDRHLQTLAGQPPWRDDSRFQAGKLEAMFKMPGKLDVDKLLDREVFTTRGAVDDLGLDPAIQNEWAQFLESVVYSSNEELSMRQQLHEKMRASDWDPELRKVMFQRAMSLFRNTRKSVLTPDDLAKSKSQGTPALVLTPDQLQKADAKVDQKLVAFLRQNPEPDDHEVHALAEKMGMDPDDLEERVYRMLAAKIKKAKDQIPGGLADKKKPSDFDPDQLRAGIAVELEHSKNDRKLAREIAMDHLAEDPAYYRKLKMVEKSELRKAKYKRRWRGPKGDWQYEYETSEQARAHRHERAEPHINTAQAAHKRMSSAFTDVRNHVLIATGVGLSEDVTSESWEKAAKALETGAKELQAKNDAWARVRKIRRDPAPDTRMRSGTPDEFREVAQFARMRAAGIWPDQLPVGIHYLGSESTNRIIRKWNEHITTQEKAAKKAKRKQPKEPKTPEKKPQGKGKQLGLFKAEPRGGTYHRRVPYTAKGGKQKFRYYYDPEKYNQVKDAHQSGEEMSKVAMGRAIDKALETAADKGCAPDDLKELAKKYGGKQIAEHLKAGCGEGGAMSYKGGRFYRSKKKESDKGDG